MDGSLLRFDETKCRKDGLCAAVCPTRIIVGPKGEIPRADHTGSCVLCGCCIAACPSDAISHARLAATRFERIAERRPVAPEALGALIRQRRSLRVYKKDPVSREVLEAIARHAAFAPTGAHGGEGWVRHVAIVAGEENMRRVVEMTARYMEGMAALLDGFVVRQMARWNVEIRRGRSMLDDLRMRLAERAAGRDAITYDAPAAIFVHTTRSTTTPYEDCHGALMQLLLLAEAHGLGTCWNGWLVKAGSGFKSRSTEFRDFLGLPADHDVYAAATIGYPGVKLHSVPQREVEVRWIGP